MKDIDTAASTNQEMYPEATMDHVLSIFAKKVTKKDERHYLR